MESAFNEAYRIAKEREANERFANESQMNAPLNMPMDTPIKSPLNIGINLRRKLVETRKANFERRVANSLGRMGIAGRGDRYGIHNWQKEFGENPVYIAEQIAQLNINSERNRAVTARRRRQINAMPKKPGFFNRIFGRQGGRRRTKRRHSRR
jgi:hypothetical protein